jgi:hypothetical protein
LPKFFSCFCSFDIFFLSKEYTTINPKKIELNWIKDVAYRKSGLCSKNHIKTCGPGNSIFLIEFLKSNFYKPISSGYKTCGPRNGSKIFSILRGYKIRPISSLDAKVVTVLKKLLESGFQWT